MNDFANSSTLKSFEQLECYRLARELRRRVSALVRTFPPQEKFRLCDQLIRSTRSVTANIAEGFGRHHHQENLQFCRQARGSLSETLDHVLTAKDEGLIGTGEYEAIRELIDRTWKVLNGYLAYLSRCSKEGVPSSHEERTTEHERANEQQATGNYQP